MNRKLTDLVNEAQSRLKDGTLHIFNLHSYMDMAYNLALDEAAEKATVDEDGCYNYVHGEYIEHYSINRQSILDLKIN